MEALCKSDLSDLTARMSLLTNEALLVVTAASGLGGDGPIAGCSPDCLDVGFTITT